MCLPGVVTNTNFDAQRDARVSAGKREEYRQSPPPPSSSSSPPTAASTPPSSAIVSEREREREKERELFAKKNTNFWSVSNKEEKRSPNYII
jgi:hypothetical protein